LKWILGKDVKQLFGFLPQARCCNLPGVPLRLLGINNPPPYHPGFSLHFSTGVLRPLRMDSLIPGMDKRYKVSWMDRQSSSEIKIAFDLLPVIWIGSWDSAAWSSNLKRFALASVALIVVIRITSIVNVHENVRKVKRIYHACQDQRPCSTLAVASSFLFQLLNLSDIQRSWATKSVRSFSLSTLLFHVSREGMI
jgi:hypothetical protein